MKMAFLVPQYACNLLKDYTYPWAVAGGWAIDLFLNRETRKHGDLEILIPRQDQFKIRAYLNGWEFTYSDNGIWDVWEETHELHLPIHQIRAADPSRIHILELMLNECEDGLWRFRRKLSVQLPMEKLILSSQKGIPILCPGIVLLFKAKASREKDEIDFTHTIEYLNDSQRNWLYDSIKEMHGVAHPWLAAIDALA